VASDIAAHREAASLVEGGAVQLVSPRGSPLELADAISAAGASPRPTVRLPVPSWDAVVDRTLAIYEELVPRRVETATADERFMELSVPRGRSGIDIALETRASRRL
jgi:hypothetical protein